MIQNFDMATEIKEIIVPLFIISGNMKKYYLLYTDTNS